MKVRDLIEKLKQYDPELPVKTDYLGNYCELREEDIEVKNEDGLEFLALD